MRKYIRGKSKKGKNFWDWRRRKGSREAAPMLGLAHAVWPHRSGWLAVCTVTLVRNLENDWWDPCGIRGDLKFPRHPKFEFNLQNLRFSSSPTISALQLYWDLKCLHTAQLLFVMCNLKLTISKYTVIRGNRATHQALWWLSP